MKAATKTRTQRRMEKKQALLLLVLVLVVSLASFTLGVMVGQRGAKRDLALQQQAAEKVLVTKVPPRTAPLAKVKPAETAAESDAGEKTELTFYDKLAQESSAPLGSGINLPPEEKAPAATSQPPIALPAEPIVKKEPVKVAAVPSSAPEAAPADSVGEQPKVYAQGGFSVQVGSFSTAVDAGKLKKQLLDKGYPAFVVEADLGAKGLWYRVRLGPYADESAAKSMQALVERRDKIKGFISRQ